MVCLPDRRTRTRCRGVQLASGICLIVICIVHLFLRYFPDQANALLSWKNQSAREGRKVISMSLYGKAPRYTVNAIRNLQFAKTNFPGWHLRMYVEKTDKNSKSRYPAVPNDIIEQLKAGGAELVYVNTSTVKVPPMMWRFLVADDLDVDVFIVRDCDSHLTKRDAAVVTEWLKTKKDFHCIRDHPSHGRFAINGGLWGARRKALRLALRNKSIESCMSEYIDAALQDMEFLSTIWPLVKFNAYCHDSVTCNKWPNSHPFPVKRIGQEHIGAVYDEKGNMRMGDKNILKATPINKKCVPPL